jgi:phytoene desaturase
MPWRLFSCQAVNPAITVVTIVHLLWIAMNTVAIVGGGLGALSGAVHLAARGFHVELFEKNARVGGKMNERILSDATGGRYRFDTGPSLLTMPFVIDELFAAAGKTRADHLEFVPIDPICRYFYHDGTVLSASANRATMLAEIQRVSSPEEAQNYQRFLDYSERIYRLTADIFLFTPFQELRKLLQWRFVPSLLQLPAIDPFRSVHTSVQRFFKDERLVQIFDRYATYNGSNPFQAPATLNVIPWVEYGIGGYYIRGGLYRLVEQLHDVARSLGVKIHTNAPVEKILHDGKRVRGLRVAGNDVAADTVLCNADVVEAHAQLIDGFAHRRKRLQRLEPSLSGMVFLWGVQRTFPELAHHNIVFSSDYEREFRQIFHEQSAPDDPTIYVSITSKNDPDHAPKGHENWFVLLNMPYVNGQNWHEEAERMRAATLKRLKAVGLDVEPHIVAEECISPEEFYRLYASNKGSIYGISSNTQTAAFLRPANRSRDLQGLYFCGGSSHPGGGVPLVLLSGKMAAELIAEERGV